MSSPITLNGIVESPQSTQSLQSQRRGPTGSGSAGNADQFQGMSHQSSLAQQLSQQNLRQADAPPRVRTDSPAMTRNTWRTRIETSTTGSEPLVNPHHLRDFLKRFPEVRRQLEADTHRTLHESFGAKVYDTMRYPFHARPNEQEKFGNITETQVRHAIREIRPDNNAALEAFQRILNNTDQPPSHAARHGISLAVRQVPRAIGAGVALVDASVVIAIHTFVAVVESIGSDDS